MENPTDMLDDKNICIFESPIKKFLQNPDLSYRLDIFREMSKQELRFIENIRDASIRKSDKFLNLIRDDLMNDLKYYIDEMYKDKDTSKYPKTISLYKLLMQYIALECEAFSYDKFPPSLLLERIIFALSHILDIPSDSYTDQSNENIIFTILITTNRMFPVTRVLWDEYLKKEHDQSRKEFYVGKPYLIGELRKMCFYVKRIEDYGTDYEDCFDEDQCDSEESLNERKISRRNMKIKTEPKENNYIDESRFPVLTKSNQTHNRETGTKFTSRLDDSCIKGNSLKTSPKKSESQMQDTYSRKLENKQNLSTANTIHNILPDKVFLNENPSISKLSHKVEADDLVTDNIEVNSNKIIVSSLTSDKPLSIEMPTNSGIQNLLSRVGTADRIQLSTDNNPNLPIQKDNKVEDEKIENKLIPNKKMFEEIKPLLCNLPQSNKEILDILPKGKEEEIEDAHPTFPAEPDDLNLPETKNEKLINEPKETKKIVTNKEDIISSKETVIRPINSMKIDTNIKLKIPLTKKEINVTENKIIEELAETKITPHNQFLTQLKKDENKSDVKSTPLYSNTKPQDVSNGNNANTTLVTKSTDKTNIVFEVSETDKTNSIISKAHKTEIKPSIELVNQGEKTNLCDTGDILTLPVTSKLGKTETKTTKLQNEKPESLKNISIANNVLDNVNKTSYLKEIDLLPKDKKTLNLKENDNDFILSATEIGLNEKKEDPKLPVGMKPGKMCKTESKICKLTIMASKSLKSNVSNVTVASSIKDFKNVKKQTKEEPVKDDNASNHDLIKVKVDKSADKCIKNDILEFSTKNVFKAKEIMEVTYPSTVPKELEPQNQLSSNSEVLNFTADLLNENKTTCSPHPKDENISSFEKHYNNIVISEAHETKIEAEIEIEDTKLPASLKPGKTNTTEVMSLTYPDSKPKELEAPNQLSSNREILKLPLDLINEIITEKGINTKPNTAFIKNSTLQNKEKLDLKSNVLNMSNENDASKTLEFSSHPKDELTLEKKIISAEPHKTDIVKQKNELPCMKPVNKLEAEKETYKVPKVEKDILKSNKLKLSSVNNEEIKPLTIENTTSQPKEVPIKKILKKLTTDDITGNDDLPKIKVEKSINSSSKADRLKLETKNISIKTDEMKLTHPDTKSKEIEAQHQLSSNSGILKLSSVALNEINIASAPNIKSNSASTKKSTSLNKEIITEKAKNTKPNPTFIENLTLRHKEKLDLKSTILNVSNENNASKTLEFRPQPKETSSYLENNTLSSKTDIVKQKDELPSLKLEKKLEAVNKKSTLPKKEMLDLESTLLNTSNKIDAHKTLELCPQLKDEKSSNLEKNDNNIVISETHETKIVSQNQKIDDTKFPVSLKPGKINPTEAQNQVCNNSEILKIASDTIKEIKSVSAPINKPNLCTKKPALVCKETLVLKSNVVNISSENDASKTLEFSSQSKQTSSYLEKDNISSKTDIVKQKNELPCLKLEKKLEAENKISKLPKGELESTKSNELIVSSANNEEIKPSVSKKPTSQPKEVPTKTVVKKPRTDNIKVPKVEKDILKSNKLKRSSVNDEEIKPLANENTTLQPKEAPIKKISKKLRTDDIGSNDDLPRMKVEKSINRSSKADRLELETKNISNKTDKMKLTHPDTKSREVEAQNQLSSNSGILKLSSVALNEIKIASAPNIKSNSASTKKSTLPNKEIITEKATNTKPNPAFIENSTLQHKEKLDLKSTVLNVSCENNASKTLELGSQPKETSSYFKKNTLSSKTDIVKQKDELPTLKLEKNLEAVSKRSTLPNKEMLDLGSTLLNISNKIDASKTVELCQQSKDEQISNLEKNDSNIVISETHETIIVSQNQKIDDIKLPVTQKPEQMSKTETKTFKLTNIECGIPNSSGLNVSIANNDGNNVLENVNTSSQAEKAKIMKIIKEVNNTQIKELAFRKILKKLGADDISSNNDITKFIAEKSTNICSKGGLDVITKTVSNKTEITDLKNKVWEAENQCCSNSEISNKSSDLITEIKTTNPPNTKLNPANIKTNNEMFNLKSNVLNISNENDANKTLEFGTKSKDESHETEIVKQKKENTKVPYSLKPGIKCKTETKTSKLSNAELGTCGSIKSNELCVSSEIVEGNKSLLNENSSQIERVSINKIITEVKAEVLPNNSQVIKKDNPTKKQRGTKVIEKEMKNEENKNNMKVTKSVVTSDLVKATVIRSTDSDTESKKLLQIGTEIKLPNQLEKEKQSKFCSNSEILKLSPDSINEIKPKSTPTTKKSILLSEEVFDLKSTESGKNSLIIETTKTENVMQKNENIKLPCQTKPSKLQSVESENPKSNVLNVSIASNKEPKSLVNKNIFSQTEKAKVTHIVEKVNTEATNSQVLTKKEKDNPIIQRKPTSKSIEKEVEIENAQPCQLNEELSETDFTIKNKLNEDKTITNCLIPSETKYNQEDVIKKIEKTKQNTVSSEHVDINAMKMKDNFKKDRLELVEDLKSKKVNQDSVSCEGVEKMVNVTSTTERNNKQRLIIPTKDHNNSSSIDEIISSKQTSQIEKIKIGVTKPKTSHSKEDVEDKTNSTKQFVKFNLLQLPNNKHVICNLQKVDTDNCIISEVTSIEIPLKIETTNKNISSNKSRVKVDLKNKNEDKTLNEKEMCILSPRKQTNHCIDSILSSSNDPVHCDVKRRVSFSESSDNMMTIKDDDVKIPPKKSWEKSCNKESIDSCVPTQNTILGVTDSKLNQSSKKKPKNLENVLNYLNTQHVHKHSHTEDDNKSVLKRKRSESEDDSKQFKKVSEPEGLDLNLQLHNNLSNENLLNPYGQVLEERRNRKSYESLNISDTVLPASSNLNNINMKHIPDKSNKIYNKDDNIISILKEAERDMVESLKTNNSDKITEINAFNDENSGSLEAKPAKSDDYENIDNSKEGGKVIVESLPEFHTSITTHPLSDENTFGGPTLTQNAESNEEMVKNGPLEKNDNLPDCDEFQLPEDVFPYFVQENYYSDSLLVSDNSESQSKKQGEYLSCLLPMNEPTLEENAAYFMSLSLLEGSTSKEGVTECISNDDDPKSINVQNMNHIPDIEDSSKHSHKDGDCDADLDGILNPTPVFGFNTQDEDYNAAWTQSEISDPKIKHNLPNNIIQTNTLYIPGVNESTINTMGNEFDIANCLEGEIKNIKILEKSQNIEPKEGHQIKLTTAVKSPAIVVKLSTTVVKSPTRAVESPTTAVKSPTTAVKSPTTAVKSPTTAVKSPTSQKVKIVLPPKQDPPLKPKIKYLRNSQFTKVTTPKNGTKNVKCTNISNSDELSAVNIMKPIVTTNVLAKEVEKLCKPDSAELSLNPLKSLSLPTSEDKHLTRRAEKEGSNKHIEKSVNEPNIDIKMKKQSLAVIDVIPSTSKSFPIVSSSSPVKPDEKRGTKRTQKEAYDLFSMELNAEPEIKRKKEKIDFKQEMDLRKLIKPTKEKNSRDKNSTLSDAQTRKPYGSPNRTAPKRVNGSNHNLNISSYQVRNETISKDVPQVNETQKRIEKIRKDQKNKNCEENGGHASKNNESFRGHKTYITQRNDTPRILSMDEVFDNLKNNRVTRSSKKHEIRPVITTSDEIGNLCERISSDEDVFDESDYEPLFYSAPEGRMPMPLVQKRNTRSRQNILVQENIKVKRGDLFPTSNRSCDFIKGQQIQGMEQGSERSRNFIGAKNKGYESTAHSSNNDLTFPVPANIPFSTVPETRSRRPSRRDDYQYISLNTISATFKKKFMQGIGKNSKS